MDKVQPQPLRSPRRLVIGFGGLLFLVAFAGVNALHVLQVIRASNDEIRQDFLYRNRTLNELRSSLYLSGTYVRDYLLDPDASQAEIHHAALERVRTSMAAALTDYAHHLSPDETSQVESLQRDLDDYWRVLAPVLEWSVADRQSRGDAFLRKDVYPRRTEMLAVADSIAAVNERQLETGNQRVLDLFDQVRDRLALTLGITFTLGLVLAAVSLTSTVRLEQEAAARYAENEHSRYELRALSARLLESQENERRAISLELHDEVGQTLSAIIVELGNVSASLTGDDAPTMRSRLDAVKKLAEQATGVVRNMALLLRPSMLDDLGLIPALRWQARETSRRTGLRVEAALDDTLATNLPDSYKTCIYRIVQEALHNCSRHAEAHVCRITLRHLNGELQLTVQDDGKGFNKEQDRGLGLLGIQERVEQLNGHMRIESSIGAGTMVAVFLPLPDAATANLT
ncbi:MAG: MCP four helix bundle domain-containing protein [Acidobacteriaceae bacterium]|nr:MCP four helix bundle domain-containing protein [Acidobacteriaceae bacterium]